MLLNFFFILFIIDLFIVLYSIYLFFEMRVFQGMQGTKLQIKSKLDLRRLILKFKFVFLSCVLSVLLNIYLFKPILSSPIVIIDYGFKSFDICKTNLELWIILKYVYIISLIVSRIVIFNSLYNFFAKPNKKDEISNSFPSNSLHLLINNSNFISEGGLYQNILVTGAIGSGKTQGIMYPFTKQLISFNSPKLRNANS